MRLDKYLKVSRIIKRRTLAKDAAEEEHIYLNGKVAKPSKEVKIGDIIMIDYFKKQVSFEVTSIDMPHKASDADMFKLLEVKEK